MTRETKIGLLVGLAFIIVIGILLSEHLTTSTETPSAALAMAGSNVRQGVVAPGVRPVTPPVTDLPPAMPQAPVPTPGDLTPPGRAEVAVGGPVAPADGAVGPIVISPAGDGRRAESQAGPIAPPIGDGVVVTRLPDRNALQDAAARMGEALVPVNGQAVPNSTNPTNTRQYKAQAGDTLSRIASLLAGGNTKANRDAIVKLNPTLQKDPNKIIAGRTYLLPLDGAVTAGARPAAPVETPRVENAAAKSASNAATYVYVVKAGDSLTKIALEQLGTTAAVATIKELNQDVLKGTDVVKIDMKLKLPAKSMAAGN